MVSPLDVAEPDLEIGCEWAEYECLERAVVASQACGDDRHYTVCAKHLNHLRKWFAANRGSICVCGRPFLDRFETHYTLVEL